MNFRAAPHEGDADRGKTGNGAARRHHARRQGVLSIKPFRRLWISLSLSSLGDWLSIVALTALAPSLASGGAVAKSSAQQSLSAANHPTPLAAGILPFIGDDVRAEILRRYLDARALEEEFRPE